MHVNVMQPDASPLAIVSIIFNHGHQYMTWTGKIFQIENISTLLFALHALHTTHMTHPRLG